MTTRRRRGGSEKTEMNLAAALGARGQTSVQVLTVYVPNKDRVGRPIRSQGRWVREAASILARIGGGVTIMPPVKGGWLSPSGRIIWEEPVIVYTFVKPREFIAEMRTLRAFLHRMGRETRQGEIVVEFDGALYRITEYDGD